MRIRSNLHIITDCRDAADNKFLELAVDGCASAIVSGDADLLILHPFREIPILSARDYLSRYGAA
jgi:predicted nucleic acid-binding protein